MKNTKWRLSNRRILKMIEMILQINWLVLMIRQHLIAPIAMMVMMALATTLITSPLTVRLLKMSPVGRPAFILLNAVIWLFHF